MDNLIEFDDLCIKTVMRWLQDMNDMCLKEREHSWETILGFVIEHIEWFKRLKDEES